MNTTSYVPDRRFAAPHTVTLHLGRSPLRARIIVRGALAALGISILAVALGWAIVAMHPMTVDAAVDGRPALPGWLVSAARVISYFGHALVITPIAVAAAILARRQWGTWDFGLLLLVTLGGSTAVTGVVKLLTDRARPDDALTSTLSSAFPSGHAVRAVAVYGLIAWLLVHLSRHFAVRHVAIPLAVSLIALSGASRIGLGAHWPTDVLAGFAVGAAWLFCALRLLQPRLVRRPPPPDTPPPAADLPAAASARAWRARPVAGPASVIRHRRSRLPNARRGNSAPR